MEKFKDLKYERPNLKAFEKEVKTFLKAFKNASSYEEANRYFLDYQTKMSEIETQYVLAYVRNTINMKDEFYDAEMKFFNTAMPKTMPLMKKCTQALLKSPFRSEFEKEYGLQLFKNAEISEKLMKPSIILPSIKENNLKTAYSKTVATCSVEFMGETCNFYGLLRHMQSTDREERRAAFLEWAKLYEGIAPALEEQYGKLVKLRCTIAKKLGFNSYIDYVYLSRGRYDYNAEKVAAFREAVRKYITPICEQLYKEQAERIGVDTLQMYDEEFVFPDGNANPIGTPEELVAKALDMYSEMSPETKEFFTFMTDYELFDLVTKDGKRAGGYCTSISQYKAPFIFSNFNGTSADIDVLTHEAGHAFEFYYASRRQPLPDLASSTSEINEIHSMTMEHFAYPYMERFFGDKTNKYRYAHFTSAVKTIPYLVSVDEFQHRVFENPTSGPADWRAFWKEIEAKYMPWRKYDGNAFLESGGYWMQKQHIFLFPFYYVDYALAQLGAFSLFRDQVNGKDAWGSYLKLCAMGGKYGYFETLEKAGIPNPLEEETVRSIADFVQQEAEKLKDELG
ncbi:MAG: M3 family oligoendopeptidase [Clostridia bacterium]|nr:M3 family oligoendopeptidase [Clostridia bacterium]